ncbi:S-layer protein sap [Paenibacillus plantiphilus]|uniref:S-layer protein sap n=1 Tax=Paenibacillus plantiphilus TaxID=2905650 RepID=A0ABM9CVB1_9BACL|nr:S-layer homology domain-containing protein [Paenibacillus plantiphilus]CAH1223749.1 S-layer protein sap [Paenibacillus plantiphilus]
MELGKSKKITKYIVSSTMVVNAMAAPVAVFAANDKVDPALVPAAVQELLDKGILQGDHNGNVNLEGKLTRIQVAAILARALNLDVSKSGTVSFTDVSSDSWGLKYIASLQNLGIMVGDNGKFRPNAYLTKEELATILVRVTQTNIVGKGNNMGISDAGQVSDWAKGYVQAALEAGLIPSQDGKFDPKGQITRQQVAQVASNFTKNVKFEEYKSSINTLLDEGKKISNSDPTV